MSLPQRLLAALWILCLGGCFNTPEDATERTIRSWLYEGALDSLRAHFSPELSERIETQGGLERLYTRVIQPLAPEEELVNRAVFQRGPVTHVVRTVRYAQDPEVLRNLWIAYGPDGAIHQLSLRKNEDSLCLSRERSRICLRLPFAGTWTVLHGGPLREQNQHAMHPQQCYAVEWHRLENGISHLGSGESNSDYFAYGEPVLAPASGIVVQVERGVPENIPGASNYHQPLGNFVMLDHHTGEYSVTAGLLGASIPWAPGDTVIAGDVLGQCGNNGLRREPAVQFHLQSSPEGGEARPMGFTELRVNGTRRPYWKPVTGETMTTLWRGSSRIGER